MIATFDKDLDDLRDLSDVEVESLGGRIHSRSVSDASLIGHTLYTKGSPWSSKFTAFISDRFPLRKALKHLRGPETKPPTQLWRVAYLMVVQRLDVPEVAARLGVPNKVVRRDMERAIKAIQLQLACIAANDRRS